MEYTVKQFKGIYQDDVELRKHLTSLREGLVTARERMIAEETEVAAGTVEAMNRVCDAIAWFEDHEEDMDSGEYDETFRKHMAALELAPHIINDAAGPNTVRDYMTAPGQNPQELGEHLAGLGGLGLNFSKGKKAFMDPGCREYFASKIQAGEDWDKREETYTSLLNLMMQAGPKIAFQSDEDRIEYQTYAAALYTLQHGTGVITKLKDANGEPLLNKDGKQVEVKVNDVAEASKLLADKKFNTFLYKKYNTVGDKGQAERSVVEFLNRELEAVDVDAYRSGQLKSDIDFLCDTVTVTKEEKPVRKSAAEWIEYIKDNSDAKAYDPMHGEESSFVTNRHMMAQILAVRDLAGAVPGDTNKLKNTQISQQELDKKTSEIENDGTFFLARVIESIKKDREFHNFADMSKKTQYFDELDTSIKAYLLKEKPGRLYNAPIYRRYMPTVKERIEQLQKQAKRAKNEDRLTEIAAEIVMLRNLGQAHRGKKASLNQPIPTDGASSLVWGVTALKNDPTFKQLVREKKDLIRKGHGGQLVDEMREYADTLKNQNPPKKLKDTSKALLEKNTIGGRMAQIRIDAGNLKKQIDQELNKKAPDEEKLQDLQAKGGKLMLEYRIFRDESRRNVKGMEAGTGANIRWMNVNEAMERRMNTDRFMLMEDELSAEQLSNGLKALAEKSPDEYFDGNLNIHNEEQNMLALNNDEVNYINDERQTGKSKNFEDGKKEENPNANELFNKDGEKNKQVGGFGI